MNKETTPEQTNKQTNLKSFQFHSTNPFLDNLLLDKRRKLVATSAPKDKAVINRVTGELEDGLFIGIKKEVDTEQFVKIYINQLSGIFELSKVGKQVFSYVLSVMDYSDTITFDLEACKEFTGYKSKVSVLAGLTELLEKEFLARGSTYNVYFINPAICYKGDRIVLVTEYRRKRTKKLENANQITLFDERKTGKGTD